MTEIESKIFLDLARIWNLGPGEVETIVRDYIGAVTCDFRPLQPYPKPHIKPVKVKTLKERLEEATMHEDCYFCIKRDICTKDVPKPCRYSYTEDQRKADQASDIYGYILAGMYLPKTYQKKKEEEMKATSVQNIKNVKDISITIENDPIERESKLTLVASTNDDIFAFEFEGPDLLQSCKRSGLFTGWEKDQKIRELENQNKKLLDTNRKLQEKIFCKDHTINELEKELSCWRKRKFTNEKITDNVNHPSHYTGRYECIDVMQDVFGNEATDNFCLCNAFKYIWRARKKNGLEDVKKAVWYLNKYIEEAENGVRKGEQI